MFGILLGFSLSRLGFSDYGQVHNMFTLSDLRLIFVFGGAVLLTALGYICLMPLSNRRTVPHNPFHKGIIPGGLLFGAGWALTGGCPAIPLVQLGEGRLPALFSAIGIFIGIHLFRAINARYLRIDTGSCGLDNY